MKGKMVWYWMVVGLFVTGCDTSLIIKLGISGELTPVIDTENDTGPGLGGTDDCDIAGRDYLCNQIEADGQVFLKDDENYAFSNTFHISHTVVKGSTPELVFDWSELTTDILGRSINPAQDIDLVMISLWNLSKEKLAYQISTDTLEMQANKGAFWVEPDGTSTRADLLEFGPFAEQIGWEGDNGLHKYFTDGMGYDPGIWTHMVMAQSGLQIGNNIRMLGFFTLDSNSNNTQYSLTSNSTKLTYTVDMTSQEWVPATVRNADITVNWEFATQNMMGADFIPRNITRVVVAHFDMDLCELEDSFLNMMELANGWWEKRLDQASLSTSLSYLVEKNTGEAFPGIDKTGTWVLALFCDMCANPAPWFMTVLYPCE